MSNAHDADSVSDRSWFSVRCVFQNSDGTPTSYEERITLWRATTFEEAIALAEAEAGDYAELVGDRYLGLAQAYHVADEIGHGAEVYSLIRDSQLPSDAYLTTFFNTGWEHQGVYDEPTADHPAQPRNSAADRANPGYEEPPPTS